MKKHYRKQGRIPFYAHLLSSQEMRQLAAGSTSPKKDQLQPQTEKYPSDNDETGAALDSPGT